MSNAHEIGQTVQDQTLDVVRMAQDAVVEAVTAWTETVNYFPGFAEFTKQFPTAAELIDINFDLAQQILTYQRDFVHRIVAATTPTATTPKAIALKAVDAPVAVDAPAVSKKTAVAKRATAAKKSPAVRPAETAE